MASEQSAERDSLPKNRLGKRIQPGAYRGKARSEVSRRIVLQDGAGVTQPCHLLRSSVFPTRTRRASTLDLTIFPGVWVEGSTTLKKSRGWTNGRTPPVPRSHSARRASFVSKMSFLTNSSMFCAYHAATESFSQT